MTHMKKNHVYLLFLMWLCLIATLQIILFTNGFLLRRITQSDYSTCIENLCTVENVTCKDELQVSNETYCLGQRAKVIILLIDALRYDFTVFNESLKEPLPYQNKLPIISEKLKTDGENTRLYKFIADPPTTTMQRLKAITTGSLPTFIDVSSNFASHEIDEDNIIDQLKRGGHNIIFLGDDTWDRLYPRRFRRNYPFPSFNVWDLDTVDTGIINNIYEQMERNDWSLLIGHFLGVDHVGHKHGPNHPEMIRKLSQMNEVIRNVTEKMGDDTMLIVMGDHGMTETGDHGGETSNEVTAGLFVHSKLPLLNSPYKTNDTIKQVDLVPTLSTILGVPIPYSNLGSIVYDIIPKVNGELAQWRFSRQAIWSNIQQLVNYIRVYSNNSEVFSKEKLREIDTKYGKLRTTLQHVQNSLEFDSIALGLHDFIKEVRSMCEEVWIQFDAYAMARGLLVFSHLVIFVFMVIEGFTLDLFESTVTKTLISTCYGLMVICVTASYLLTHYEVVVDFSNAACFSCGISSLLVLLALIIPNFQTVAVSFYENRRWQDLFGRLVILTTSLTLLGNSYVIEEAKIMLFLLITLLLTLVLEVLHFNTNKSIFYNLKHNKIIIGMLTSCWLIRFTLNYWKCRDEMGCANYFSTKTATQSDWVIFTLSLLCFVVLCRAWLRACGNLNGFSYTVLLGRYTPIVTILLSSGFWVLHNMPKTERIKLLGPWKPDVLAVAIYGLIGLSIILLYISPLCVYHLKKSQPAVDLHSQNVIPQLAKHLYKSRSNESKVPVVYGLATVYSASFILLSTYVIILWSLLLGPSITPSLMCMTAAVAFLLLVSAISRCKKSQELKELLDPQFLYVILWFIVCNYLFYATSHQATFNSIEWQAAFIGTSGEFSNNFVPAALVIINTFGSHIFTGITLPLFYIAPFSLHVMLPNILSTKAVNLQRGDMILFDNRRDVSVNLFKFGCKYIICHALRVFIAMLAATIHCRHLMVWNIFAPKLIFEIIGFFATMASVIVGYGLFVRVTNCLDKFISALEKEIN